MKIYNMGSNNTEKIFYNQVNIVRTKLLISTDCEMKRYAKTNITLINSQSPEEMRKNHCENLIIKFKTIVSPTKSIISKNVVLKEQSMIKKNLNDFSISQLDSSESHDQAKKNIYNLKKLSVGIKKLKLPDQPEEEGKKIINKIFKKSSTIKQFRQGEAKQDIVINKPTKLTSQQYLPKLITFSSSSQRDILTNAEKGVIKVQEGFNFIQKLCGKSIYCSNINEFLFHAPLHYNKISQKLKSIDSELFDILECKGMSFKEDIKTIRKRSCIDPKTLNDMRIKLKQSTSIKDRSKTLNSDNKTLRKEKRGVTVLINNSKNQLIIKNVIRKLTCRDLNVDADAEAKKTSHTFAKGIDLLNKDHEEINGLRNTGFKLDFEGKLTFNVTPIKPKKEDSMGFTDFLELAKYQIICGSGRSKNYESNEIKFSKGSYSYSKEKPSRLDFSSASYGDGDTLFNGSSWKYDSPMKNSNTSKKFHQWKKDDIKPTLLSYRNFNCDIIREQNSMENIKNSSNENFNISKVFIQAEDESKCKSNYRIIKLNNDYGFLSKRKVSDNLSYLTLDLKPSENDIVKKKSYSYNLYDLQLHNSKENRSYDSKINSSYDLGESNLYLSQTNRLLKKIPSNDILINSFNIMNTQRIKSDSSLKIETNTNEKCSSNNSGSLISENSLELNINEV